jgi:hypothetical protein
MSSSLMVNIEREEGPGAWARGVDASEALLARVRQGWGAPALLEAIRRLPFRVRYAAELDASRPHLLVMRRLAEGELWFAVMGKHGRPRRMYHVGRDATTTTPTDALPVKIEQQRKVKQCFDNRVDVASVCIVSRLGVCDESDVYFVDNCRDACVTVDDARAKIADVDADPVGDLVACASAIQVMNGMRYTAVRLVGGPPDVRVGAVIQWRASAPS